MLDAEGAMYLRRRPLAIGAVLAVAGGAVAGLALQLPAEMSAPPRPPEVIRALDPNYAAYLKVLASLGPASKPPPRYVARPAAEPRRSPAWREVEADDEEMTGWAEEPRPYAYAWQGGRRDWRDEPPGRRYEPPPASARYYYGPADFEGEPLPPPPPRPSRW